jgi:hypothetical protein
MRNSPTGWKPDDLIYVYKSYGFEVRAAGSGHYVASHAEYRELRATFPMTGDLLPVYVRRAIKQVDTIEAARREHNDKPS